MEKTFHDIDDTVKIDFEVPSILKEIMDFAEESDIAEDGNYYNWADTIETMAKNLYVEGVLSAKQWDALSRRYKQW